MQFKPLVGVLLQDMDVESQLAHKKHVMMRISVKNCEGCYPNEDRRTFREWNESGEFDFRVLDPDGFPRHDLTAMQNARYTRDEFYERAMGSTIQPLGGSRGQ